MVNGRVIGQVSTYADLRKLIAFRRRELRLSQEALNHLAGLQGGYVNKLECGDRCFGDISLDAVLGALGVEIALVQSRAPHEEPAQQTRGMARVRLRNICAANGAKGGKKCQGRRTDEERARFAKRAAKLRWKRWRETRAAAIAAAAAKPTAAPENAKAPAI